eukprot:7466457-Karenia_brevis.AAC.1
MGQPFWAGMHYKEKSGRNTCRCTWLNCKLLAAQEVHGSAEEMSVGLERLSAVHAVKFSAGLTRATGG